MAQPVATCRRSNLRDEPVAFVDAQAGDRGEEAASEVERPPRLDVAQRPLASHQRVHFGQFVCEDARPPGNTLRRWAGTPSVLWESAALQADHVPAALLEYRASVPGRAQNGGVKLCRTRTRDAQDRADRGVRRAATGGKPW